MDSHKLNFKDEYKTEKKQDDKPKKITLKQVFEGMSKKGLPKNKGKPKNKK